MHDLLKKDVYIIWTSDMQQNFKNIKQTIAAATEPVHYNLQRGCHYQHRRITQGS